MAALWRAASELAARGPGAMGLAEGERPAADVEVLRSTLAVVEQTLAAFQHAATVAGCLPMPAPGGMLTAAGWGGPWARRLARSGALAAEHPTLAHAWATGLVTSDHLDPVARHAHRFTADELAAVVEQLTPLWGQVSPPAVERFVVAAHRMLHPPDEPTRAELDAYQTRALSFALTRDCVVISGELPRIEGEAVIAAIDALAERLRTAAEHVPASARRADALVQLVNAAAAHDALPQRGGLPVAVSVTLEHTALGDLIATTSRGHQLTEAETRWACCDAQVTPVLVDAGLCPPPEPGPSACAPEVPGPELPARSSAPPDTAAHAVSSSHEEGPPHTRQSRAPARLAVLAALLFDARQPLAVGRTARTATAAQRRALAARDRGCVIPGCPVPAEACQAHHLTDWAAGGATEVANLVSLCWQHHRQVDLKLWTITPRPPRGGSKPPARSSGWTANHGAPFTITRTPRHSWRT